MNLALYIYLCDVVGNIGGLLHVSAIFSAICLFANALTFFICLEWKEDRSRAFRLFRYTVPACFLMFFISSVVPSQKTMYAMAAAYYGEQAVKSETFQRLNGKAMQLLEVKIDEFLEVKK